MVDVIDPLSATSPHQLRWPCFWWMPRLVVVVSASRIRAVSNLLGVWLVPSSSTSIRSVISSRRLCSFALARGGSTVYFCSFDATVLFLAPARSHASIHHHSSSRHLPSRDSPHPIAYRAFHGRRSVVWFGRSSTHDGRFGGAEELSSERPPAWLSARIRTRFGPAKDHKNITAPILLVLF